MSFSLWASLVVLFYFVTKSESRHIGVLHSPDGFVLEDLEPNKYFSIGVIPSQLQEEMSMTFYDVYFPETSCQDGVTVEVYENGYIKNGDVLGRYCDSNGLSDFVARSSRGFHVVVRTGPRATRGVIKAKFSAPSGFQFANEVLFG